MRPARLPTERSSRPISRRNANEIGRSRPRATKDAMTMITPIALNAIAARIRAGLGSSPGSTSAQHRLTHDQKQHGEGWIERQSKAQRTGRRTMSIAAPEQPAPQEEEDRRSRNSGLPALRHHHRPHGVHRHSEQRLFERVLQHRLKQLRLRRAFRKTATVDVLRREEPMARQKADPHREPYDEKHIPSQRMRQRGSVPGLRSKGRGVY